MKSETKYYISIDEVREILSHHIDKSTSNGVYVNPQDIEFDIRYNENGCCTVCGVKFTLDEEIEL